MATTTFTSIDHHRKADNSIDWESYRAAQVANGESCYECGGIASTFGTGKRELCYGCKDLRSDEEEVTHDSRIRCPACKHVQEAYGGDNYELLSEGEHDATCGECGADFEVSTSVSYSFTSRAKDE